jgi:hypothetical protein
LNQKEKIFGYCKEGREEATVHGAQRREGRIKIVLGIALQKCDHRG